MLFLKQPQILLCDKSGTTCQIDSYMVSNSKLKPDLRSCVKTEMIESTAPPQQLHKQGTMFWEHSLKSLISVLKMLILRWFLQGKIATKAPSTKT